jgi:hypothetical protein
VFMAPANQCGRKVAGAKETSDNLTNFQKMK